MLDQVDQLFGDVDLPTAEELACWRTLLPAIADLVASVGQRFQAGEDLLDRLPDWLPDEPASLLGGLGDGLVGISTAIRNIQDTFLDPAALVERVNTLFRSADIPLLLSHGTVGSGPGTTDRYELRPSADLQLSRTIPLDAAGFAASFAARGSQVGTVLNDILALVIGDLAATFQFELAAGAASPFSTRAMTACGYSTPR